MKIAKPNFAGLQEREVTGKELTKWPQSLPCKNRECTDAHKRQPGHLNQQKTWSSSLKDRKKADWQPSNPSFTALTEICRHIKIKMDS